MESAKQAINYASSFIPGTTASESNTVGESESHETLITDDIKQAQPETKVPHSSRAEHQYDENGEEIGDNPKKSDDETVDNPTDQHVDNNPEKVEETAKSSSEPQHKPQNTSSAVPTGTQPSASKGGDTGGSSLPKDTSTEKGTGDKYVKSTGLQKDGGDFDAANPGAGHEAQRLLEKAGRSKPSASEESSESTPSETTKSSKPSDTTDSTNTTDTTDDTDSPEKTSLKDKIKNKLSKN